MDKSFSKRVQADVGRRCRRYFTENKVKYEGKKGDGEKYSGGDERKPLIIMQIFTLEIGEPVKLSHDKIGILIKYEVV